MLNITTLNCPHMQEVDTKGERHMHMQHACVMKDFCRTMPCKYGLCRHAVSVIFVDSVETNKRIFKIFSPSSSHTILVFPYQTSWQYSDGDPLMGASNGGGVGKNRDLSHIYLAVSRAVNDSTARCNVFSCDGPWQVDDTSRW